MNKSDSIEELLQICQLDPFISKEEIKNAFAQLQEIFRSQKSKEEFASLVDEYFDNILITLSTLWFQRGEEHAVSLVSMLCEWIKEITLLYTSIDKIRNIVSTFSLFIQEHPHPTIIKSVLQTSTSLFPLWLFATSKDSSLYTLLSNLRKQIDDSFLFHSSNDGVRNASIKWIHMLILMYSSPIDNTTPQSYDIPSLLFMGNSIIPNNLEHDPSSIAQSYLQLLMNLCIDSTMSAGNVTAILNLCTQLLKYRPYYAPIVLSTVLDISDHSNFSDTQLKSIVHMIKLQLVSLLKLPYLYEFVPMIRQTIAEMEKEKTSGDIIDSDTTSKSKIEKLQDDPEMTRKQRKHKIITFERTKFPFSIEDIPQDMLVDIVLGSLIGMGEADMLESLEMFSGKFEISKIVQKKEERWEEEEITEARSSEDLSMSFADVSYDQMHLYHLDKLLMMCHQSNSSCIDTQWRIVWIQIMARIMQFKDQDEILEKLFSTECPSYNARYLIILLSSWYQPESNILSKVLNITSSSETNSWMNEPVFHSLVPRLIESNSLEKLISLWKEQYERILPIVKELVLVRPICRPFILPLMMQHLVHRDDSIRRATLNVCESSLWRMTKDGNMSYQSPANIELFKVMKDFLSLQLETFQKELLSKISSMEDTKEDNIDDHSHSISQYMEAYLSMCTIEPIHFLKIFPFYAAVSNQIQKDILILMDPYIRRTLREQEQEFINILFNIPYHAEALLPKILTILVDTIPVSAQLLTFIRKLFTERSHLDARYLIPILHAIDKLDMLFYIPKWIQLLDGQPKQALLFRELVIRMMSPICFGSLTPTEMLMEIHTSEGQQGVNLKQILEAVNICFSMPEVFKQEILAATIQQLAEKTPLPTLLIRSIILSLNLYHSLTPFIISILSRLISKKIWTYPQLWEGFIRCCHLIQPASLSILIQLPLSQIKDVLAQCPDLKIPMKNYLQQQPPSLRHRFQNIFSLLQTSNA